MINPSDALPSFQAALTAGALLPQSHPGQIDETLWLYVDPQTSPPRFVYFRTAGFVLTVMVVFAKAPNVEGEPCMQAGYAVPEQFRGKGLAKGALSAALAELQNGFAGQRPFFVEAIVDVSNIASQHVAAAAISDRPVAVTDEFSGAPAYRYLKRLLPPSNRLR